MWFALIKENRKADSAQEKDSEPFNSYLSLFTFIRESSMFCVRCQFGGHCIVFDYFSFSPAVTTEVVPEEQVIKEWNV